MFTNIKNAWGFLGVSLALVALYLVVTNSDGVAKVTNSGGNFLIGFFRTLQGRNA